MFKMMFKPECPEDLKIAFSWTSSLQGRRFWSNVCDGKIPFHVAMPVIDEMWEECDLFTRKFHEIESNATSKSPNGQKRLFAGEIPQLKH